ALECRSPRRRCTRRSCGGSTISASVVRPRSRLRQFRWRSVNDESGVKPCDARAAHGVLTGGRVFHSAQEFSHALARPRHEVSPHTCMELTMEKMFAALSTLVELVLVALLFPLMILLLGLPVVLLVRLLLEITSRLSRLVAGLL